MYEAQGTIKIINDTQTFSGSGFSKREFVITTGDSKYPQDIKFEVVKDKCASLDQFKVGQAVNVSFDIRGNEYQGKYYVNLSCWKIQAGSGSGTQSAPSKKNNNDIPDFSNGYDEGEPSMDDLRGDDIPF
jgi:single-strand DNA-binding protein